MGNNGDQTNLVQSAKKLENDPVTFPEVDEKIDKYFKEISKLQENDLIVRADCKFCNHPIRPEAEVRWEQTKGGGLIGSYGPVVKIFDDWEKKNPEHFVKHPGCTKMNYTNVRNHLLNHYEQQSKKIRLREYGDHVVYIMNKRMADEQKLEVVDTILQETFLDIASNNEIDPIKRADTLIKLTKIFIDVLESQAKLRGDFNAVNVVVDKFITMYSTSIKEQDNPEVKRVLIENLETFRETAGQIGASIPK